MAVTAIVFIFISYGFFAQQEENISACIEKINRDHKKNR